MIEFYLKNYSASLINTVTHQASTLMLKNIFVCETNDHLFDQGLVVQLKKFQCLPVERPERLSLPLGNVDGTGRLSNVFALGSIVLRPHSVIGNLLDHGVVEVRGHVVVEVVVVVSIAEINDKLLKMR